MLSHECGRQYCWRGYWRVAGGACAVGDPRHARRAPCARTGRSRGRRRGVGDAPSWMVRGAADQRRAGRGGNDEAEIPQCTIARSQTGAEYLRNRRTIPGEPGAEVVEGRGLPEGTASETRAGISAGQGVSSELDRVRRMARRTGSAVYCAPSPYDGRPVVGGVSGDQPKRRRWGRWGHVAGLRRGSRSEPSRSARPGPSRGVPGEPDSQGVHTEVGWAAAAARGRCVGGQDRPAGGGRGAERDLRGLLSGFLVWVSAGEASA